MPLNSKARRLRNELLAREIGGCSPPFGSRKGLALVFPNTYSLGMANLGFQFVYQQVNQQPQWLAHRSFLSPLPGYTLEAQRPLRDYQVIAFSVAYELDFLNMLKLLEVSGIPLLRQQRTQHFPLIIAGGQVASMAPQALADFVDLFTIGDGEGLLHTLLTAYERFEGDREKMLESLAPLPGFWCPESEEEPEAKLKHPHTIACLDTFPVYSEILSPDAEFGEATLIELTRGCPHHCSFCWIGHRPQPFRVLSYEIVEVLINGLRDRSRKFGFVSSAVGDYPYVNTLCQLATEQNLEISFSSLRPEAIEPDLLEALVKGGQTTITLAPETGDEQFRRRLGKTFSNAFLLEKLTLALEAGINRLKLYFLLGVPGEDEKHRQATLHLGRELAELTERHGRQRGKPTRLTLSFGIFVARPFTPLAKSLPPSPEQLKEIIEYYRQGLSRLPWTELSFTAPYEAWQQILLTIPPLNTSETLLKLYRQPRRLRRIIEELHPWS